MGKNVKYFNRSWLFNLFFIYFVQFSWNWSLYFKIRKEKPLNITH